MPPSASLTRARWAAQVRQLQQAIEERDRTIESLRKENRKLRQALEDQRKQAAKALQEAERKAARQASPFSKGRKRGRHRKPGRRHGEGPFRRREAPPPAATDLPTEEAPLPTCRCGGEGEVENYEEVTITDLPPQPTPMVRRIRVATGRCKRCGVTLEGSHSALQPGQRGATAHRLGPRAKATALALRHAIGVTQRKIPAVLQALTGLCVTHSALVQSEQRVAKTSGAREYRQLRREVVQGSTVNTDDTSWSIGGKPAQLMVFANANTTVYQIREQHRNEEVREVIPADYSGTMITDRGRSYDAHEFDEVKQQKCNGHVLRNIASALVGKEGQERAFGERLAALLRRGIRLWHQFHDGECTREQYARRGGRLSRELTEHLADGPLDCSDDERLRKDLARRHERGDLARYLTDPRIEPTNNLAEREGRPAVVERKVSQCSKNQTGADTYTTNKSIVRTEVRRGGFTNLIQRLMDRLWPNNGPPSLTNEPSRLPTAP